MKNVKRILLIALLMCFFTGCNIKDNKESAYVNLKERDSVEINDSIFTEQDFDLRVSEISIEIKPNTEVCTYCIYDETVFYVLSSQSFYESGMSDVTNQDFKKEDNTQIRMYDINSGDDKLIYQYDENFCVQVTDLQCNGTYLIWEDYNKDKNDWSIQACCVDESSEFDSIKPKTLFEKVDIDSELFTITPQMTEDSILWYDVTKDNTYSAALYRYDLQSEEISVLKNDIDMCTPYTHISFERDTLLTYKYEEGYSTIYMEKENDYLQIDTFGKIADIQGNNQVVVWKESVDENDKLDVYDVEEDKYYTLPCNQLFSFSVYDNIVIVNQKDGVYAYDIQNKAYTTIKESESGPYCLYIYNGKDNSYAHIINFDDSKFSILMLNYLE